MHFLVSQLLFSKSIRGGALFGDRGGYLDPETGRQFSIWRHCAARISRAWILCVGGFWHHHSPFLDGKDGHVVCSVCLVAVRDDIEFFMFYFNFYFDILWDAKKICSWSSFLYFFSGPQRIPSRPNVAPPYCFQGFRLSPKVYYHLVPEPDPSQNLRFGHYDIAHYCTILHPIPGAGGSVRTWSKQHQQHTMKAHTVPLFAFPKINCWFFWYYVKPYFKSIKYVTKIYYNPSWHLFLSDPTQKFISVFFVLCIGKI